GVGQSDGAHFAIELSRQLVARGAAILLDQLRPPPPISALGLSAARSVARSAARSVRCLAGRGLGVERTEESGQIQTLEEAQFELGHAMRRVDAGGIVQPAQEEFGSPLGADLREIATAKQQSSEVRRLAQVAELM